MAVALVVFAACSKTASTNSTNSNPNHIPPDQTVTASLQGRVVDENGIPVQGAVVSSGTATTSTDINGIFAFRNITVSSRFAYVQAGKSGYFTGSRSIIAGAGSSNYVNIQLIPKTAAAGTFPATTGGKVVVGTGDTAYFPASSVVEASTGTAYTGMVTVYATYLNPTDPNLYKYMPGDLRGIGSDGNETALQSFGMMDVEMQDASGNKLQLASGQQASLTFAIPDTLMPVAPASIPLWYFNDTTGRWMQQGSAVRQGTSYVGQVGHFTYWNCDAPMGTVNFKVHIVDQYRNPVAYRYIQFSLPGYGSRGGYTDSTGFAQGLIPKGEQLLMQVLAECGGFVGGANVGPALTDQDLGTVTVNMVDAKLTITGNVVDCSNNPVDSGYVNVLVDGLDYRAVVTNGTFSLPVNRCYQANASVQLIAEDLATSQTSTVTTITADTGTVSAGTLTACSMVVNNPYIDFTLGANAYNLTPATNTISQYGTGYTGISATGNLPNIYLSIQGMNGIGGYSGGIDSAFVGLSGANYMGPVTYNVTSYGPVASYIQGSFTGTLTNYVNAQDQQTIRGTFNILRTQ
jgi:protocatechuate 3,4-dioxygenase beta subunit